MKTVIKNGLVHVFQEGKSSFVKTDILLEDERIKKTGLGFTAEQEIDATDCLVLPGLINSHIHTYCHYVKGGFDNLPLDRWMLHTKPFFSGRKETPEDVYYRTLFSCIELLKNGTTMVMDDLSVSPALNGELYDAVMEAYKVAGIRADVTVDVVNKPPYQSIPYVSELTPDELKTRMNQSVLADEDEIISYMEEKIKKYNKENALQRCILAPSAPQRCTVSLMKKIKTLALKYHVPVVTHVLETAVQKECGYQFFGKSLVKWMEEQELLYPNLNLMHTVWVEDEDIAIIARNGCKTVHNPSSNFKLGSGIAPIRKLLDAGINVGLGTDNTSCSDTLNLFEEIKLAGLIHKTTCFDDSKWLGAHEAIRMATYNGAVCAGKEEELGEIAEGKLADLIILDTNNERFLPHNNYVNQFVFSENGRSVKHVIVNGKIVVKDGVIQTFDEQKVLSEFQRLVEEDIAPQRETTESEAAIMEPIYQEAYRKTLISGRSKA